MVQQLSKTDRELPRYTSANSGHLDRDLDATRVLDSSNVHFVRQRRKQSATVCQKSQRLEHRADSRDDKSRGKKPELRPGGRAAKNTRLMRILRLLTLTCLMEPTIHAQENDFPRAAEARMFSFPRDHANHPEYKTEWWYFTGTLEADDGKLFGYQATWFRSALTPHAAQRASALGARDLYFFHGSLSDVKEQRFLFDQSISRGVPGWAGASAKNLDVSLLENSLRRAPDGSWHLRCRIRGRELDLELTPKREPLLHGQEPGLSQKGPLPGQASFYYSQTRLAGTGTLTREDGSTVTVQGKTWFDHEFGSNQLTDDQVGWDWFSVTLDDGSDLMLYLLRKKDGRVETTSSGTLREADRQSLHLTHNDFTVRELEHWKSPHSGARYPAAWQIEVPGSGLSLEVRPLLPDQELRTKGTTGVTYWEGLCEFRGRHGNRKVSGKGYVELVGYAGAFLGEI